MQKVCKEKLKTFVCDRKKQCAQVDECLNTREMTTRPLEKRVSERELLKERKKQDANAQGEQRKFFVRLKLQTINLKRDGNLGCFLKK